jgi:hypothetical protein
MIDAIIAETAKPVILQCPCGQWQLWLYLDTGVIIYGNETFASEWEAVETITDRIIASGCTLGKVS